MPSTYRIHPSIGIARVGNSEEPGLIGPEMPGVPANWNFGTAAFNPFKNGGKIKRQGVRFRVFEYASDGSVIGEALEGIRGVKRIRWTVHVANRKAAFFRFDGPLGEDGDFSKNGVRNNTVGPANRGALVIDPGPVSVSGKSSPAVGLVNTDPQTSVGIPDLGNIETDSDGRLVFFGGHGTALQLPGAPVISEYANNDGWFDDVSDGPVTATLEFDAAPNIEAIPAWVTVGPPDFAPGVANVVSLYETIWDVTVREKSIPIPQLSMYRPGGAVAGLLEQRNDWDPLSNRFTKISPSFVNDIAHVFQRAFSAMFLHDPRDIPIGFHNVIGPQQWADLGSLDPLRDQLRQPIFHRLRDPNSSASADSTQMPRGLGDQYCNEEEHGVGSPERKNPRRFFSLTKTQYALMAQWAARKFNADGALPPGIPGAPIPITPEGLDRAALENCVGGPFFPGIEVSWMIRNPKIYLEPFRLRPGVVIATGDPGHGVPDIAVEPGFLTQQMALPWQADFRDCKRESLQHTHKKDVITYAMWWAGQRPDDVFQEADPNKQVSWTRLPNFTAADDAEERFQEMVDHWWSLGFVSLRDPADPRRWLETERS